MAGPRPAPVRDFTSGPVVGPLLAFAAPILANNVLLVLYNLVNAFWIGRLGADALAAVALGSVVFLLLLSFSWGLSSAATALTAQYFGAGLRDRLGRVTANLVLLYGVLSTAAAAATAAAHDPLLRALGTPPAVWSDAALYLRINLLALPFAYLFILVGAVLRGVGDSVTPLRVGALTNLLNVVLDPVLIYGPGPLPGLGVAGAAWATVASRALAAAWGLWLLQQPGRPTRARRGDWRPDPALMRTALRLGVPAGSANLVNSLGSTLLLRLVTPYGPEAVAAHGIGLRIDSVAVMPSVAMGLAAGSWVGQNLGAGKPERARTGARTALAVTFAAMLAVGLAAAAAAPRIVAAFTPDPAVRALGSTYLRILGLSWAFFAVQVTVSQTLRGAGDVVANLALAAGNHLLLRVPLALAFSRLAGGGAVGVWWGMLCGDILAAAAAYAYFRLGRWHRHRLVPAGEPASATAPGP